MGQAKLRGSYEERKKQSIERKEKELEEKAKRKEEELKIEMEKIKNMSDEEVRRYGREQSRAALSYMQLASCYQSAFRGFGVINKKGE